MIVPLAMTIYFATLHTKPAGPGTEGFVGLDNYRYFLTIRLSDVAAQYPGAGRSVLAITSARHAARAASDQAVSGAAAFRLMVIAPFFVWRPQRAGLEELLMHPVSGLVAWISTLLA